MRSVLDHGNIANRAYLALFFLIALAGCDRGSGAAVNGTVTLDGVPLDEATITFVPETGGQRQAAWAPIAGGKYAIDSSSGLGSGQFRVEIRAVRSGNEKANPNDPTLMTAKEIVPSKYNSNSELSTEIRPGKNTANFDLKAR
ncbi:MAG TPA: hypothetical protein VGI40_12860 [Pirellulaceae bacterium]|jgi:hypothetical protein